MFFLKKINFLNIPFGIRLMSWATAVRFVGWGVVEMFIPIFLLSFTDSYTETGLLRSVYDIVFLAALPIISRLSDRFSSKKIILSGLILYPFIALGYFFAGVTGAIVFVIIARALNGISYSLDSMGKRTYMRRNAHHRLGLIFGYFDTLSNFWWLLAGLVGLSLVEIVPIHYLFLLIIPTTLIAIMLVARVPREPRPASHRKFTGVLSEVYTDYKLMFRFIAKWSFEQKYAAFLYAILMALYVIIAFFFPLVSFAENHSYYMVFLLTAMANVPMLFGVPLGIIADKASRYTLRRVIFLSVLLLVFLPFIQSFVYTLLAVFLIGLGIYFSLLVLERCATDHETKNHMGSLSGAFLSMAQIAQIVAPICIGFFIDRLDIQFAIWLVCMIALSAIIPLYMRKIKI